MTLQNATPTQYVWISLADITDDPLDQERSIPEEVVQILEQLFDARRDTQTLGPGAPPGQLAMLVRGTNVVLKLTPLAINLAKAFCSAYVVIFFKDHITKLGALATFMETLPKLKACIVNLNPDTAQMCAYTAVLRAGSDVQRAIGMRPTVDQVVQAHAAFRITCTQTTCQYFRNGSCGISDSELDGVITALHKDGILTKPSSDQLWVTL